MLKALLAAGMTMLAVPAMAVPAGAPAATPMQPGGWGQGGWQQGGGATSAALTPGAMPATAMPASPPWHGDHPRADRGGHLGGSLLNPSFTVTDWRRWGLTPPPAGARWVRYYDDAVLVDAGGTVIASRDGIDWDTAPTPQPAYGTTTVRTGPDTVVTTTVAPGPAPIVTYAGGDGGYDDGDGYRGGYGGATVSVTPGTITTTTTVTEIREWGPSRARHAHRRCACRR